MSGRGRIVEFHRLSQIEKQTLLNIVENIVKRNKLSAVCAYGSKVAGYAKPDSDYDTLIVLEDYRNKIKYHYIEDEFNVSALLVDQDALIADANRALLGEFVIGRLLNIYEPLIGEEFLWDVETAYKKRVMLEILYEIASIHGPFITEIIFPLEYFLFEKLKKRATIYPPALYSYVKTYSGAYSSENLKASLKGFEEAAIKLEQEGLISYTNGIVRVRRKDLANKLARILSLLTYATRGIAQYAVHTYAGRVKPSVVSKEIISKISRSRDIGEVPEKLRQPKQLWKIEEGLLIVEGEDWIYQIAEALGLKKTFKLIKGDQLGEIYNISRVYILDDGINTIKLVVKKFKDIKSLKWALLGLWTFTKRFSMTPISRLYREYYAIRTLRRYGLNTPEIVSVILGDRILVTKFIDGVDLQKIICNLYEGKDGEEFVKIYGEAIGMAHKAGYTLGDTKPSNAIIFNGKLYLTDLEQASFGGDKAWDIAEFIYYSSKLTLNTQIVKKITESFLDGYLKYGDINAVINAMNHRYLAPFITLLMPQAIKAINEIIKKKVKY
ncbi:MAG: nucleotidyltransferase domain-containing protein [Nitrososphaerales archaeon]